MWLEYRMLVAMYLVDFVGEYVCGSHRDLPIDVGYWISRGSSV